MLLLTVKEISKWTRGHKMCERGRRAVKVGLVRRTYGVKKLDQHSILSRVQGRKEMSQVRTI